MLLKYDAVMQMAPVKRIEIPYLDKYFFLICKLFWCAVWDGLNWSVDSSLKQKQLGVLVFDSQAILPLGNRKYKSINICYHRRCCTLPRASTLCLYPICAIRFAMVSVTVLFALVLYLWCLQKTPCYRIW